VEVEAMSVDLAARIIADVVLETGIGVRDILGSSPARRIHRARRMVWERLRATGMSYPEIARVTNANRTSVYRGINREANVRYMQRSKERRALWPE
jgi:DNA invertase Pin-like site-specific DNA recombinase